MAAEYRVQISSWQSRHHVFKLLKMLFDFDFSGLLHEKHDSSSPTTSGICETKVQLDSAIQDEELVVIRRRPPVPGDIECLSRYRQPDDS